MAQQAVKALHFAGSVRQLQEKASLQNLDNSSVKLVLTTAAKLLAEAEKYLVSGDEELSYFFYYRYMDVVAQARKNRHYIRNKSFFENLIPKHSVAAALGRLEFLTESLERRYCLQKEEESARRALTKLMERIENERKQNHDQIQGCQYDADNVVQSIPETSYIEIGVDALSELGEQERSSKMSTRKKKEEKSFEIELEEMKAKVSKQKTEYERVLREPKRIFQHSNAVIPQPVTPKKQVDAKQRYSETACQTLESSFTPYHHKVSKVYLARNRKIALDFYSIFNMQPSSASSNLVKRTEVEVNIRPAEVSEESTKFCDILKEKIGEESTHLSISFQIKSFNKETKLLGMGIRFDGPFITTLLKWFEESWKLTFRMKLYGKQEDLHCQDTVMRVLKNEIGENAWFGIDVGLIALDEWLGDSPPLKAKVTVQLLRMET